jgi:hypothetical protein
MWLRRFILISTIFASITSSGQDTTCQTRDLDKVEFKKNSAKLSANAKTKLDSLIVIINSQPICEVLATGYSADLCDKCGALSWERQNAVISYLMKKGVPGKRLRSYTRLEGNADFVALTFTSWPLTDHPPPHPNLRRKNLDR